MTLDLAAIRARADAATLGPWTNSGGEHYAVIDSDDRPELAHVGSSNADAEFVAHAREDVPALLDMIAAALTIHRPDEHFDYRCAHDGQGWPCATARALA